MDEIKLNSKGREILKTIIHNEGSCHIRCSDCPIRGMDLTICNPIIDPTIKIPSIKNLLKLDREERLVRYNKIKAILK